MVKRRYLDQKYPAYKRPKKDKVMILPAKPLKKLQVLHLSTEDQKRLRRKGRYHATNTMSGQPSDRAQSILANQRLDESTNLVTASYAMMKYGVPTSIVDSIINDYLQQPSIFFSSYPEHKQFARLQNRNLIEEVELLS